LDFHCRNKSLGHDLGSENSYHATCNVTISFKARGNCWRRRDKNCKGRCSFPSPENLHFHKRKTGELEGSISHAQVWASELRRRLGQLPGNSEAFERRETHRSASQAYLFAAERVLVELRLALGRRGNELRCDCSFSAGHRFSIC